LKGKSTTDTLLYLSRVGDICFIIIILIGVSNMENITPNMIGERLPVMAYIDIQTFMRIEEKRGDVSRSRFVGKLLKKIIEQ
jgi:hypothetical protein